MHHTKIGFNVRTIRNREYLTEGKRFNNLTVQRHYQIEYPQDLN